MNEAARRAIEEAGGLVTATGLAKRWDISRQRVAQLAGNHERNGFPRPIPVESGPPVYLHAEVDAWHEQRSRVEP